MAFRGFIRGQELLSSFRGEGIEFQRDAKVDGSDFRALALDEYRLRSIPCIISFVDFRRTCRIFAGRGIPRPKLNALIAGFQGFICPRFRKGSRI